MLSRKIGQRIRIDIPGYGYGWITLVEIDKKQVRLGLDLPRQVEVLREELIPPAEVKS